MTETTKLKLNYDIDGKVIYAPEFSNSKKFTVLAANVAQSCTVPTDAHEYMAMFGYSEGASVFVARNSTATTPTSSFTDTVSERKPAQRTVYAGDTLSFITADTTAEVWVAFYAKR